MKCPYCGYEDFGTVEDKATCSDIGKFGEFYDISNDIVMTSNSEEDMYLYGCPRCKKLFMN